MMKNGSRKMNASLFSLLKSKPVKKRTIVVGLKSDNYSREMLLCLLSSAVISGDSVLAVHVHESNDSFDPNSFHIHEDLCKSKQVDFQVKLCTGSSYVSELSHQVRIHYATVLAVGCSSPSSKNSTVNKYLKELPPSCFLLVMDHCGKILMQKRGTSQQGSSVSSSTEFGNLCHLRKSQTLPLEQGEPRKFLDVRKTKSFPQVTQKLFDRLATLEVKGYSARFSLEELKYGTNNFSPEMLIGKGGNSKVYRAILRDGQSAAVKVLDISQDSEDDLFREVEILSGLDHDNVVQLLGYCYCKDLQAVVYVLLKQSLKQRLKQLNWSQRMQLAVGAAKALDYLHSFCPPIIHRDVKSSNILLSENNEPQLSDFGAAMVLHESQQASAVITKPIHVVGTFGYMAPEYMMYGRVDEKVDVYSYGVVLLELITGREAIQAKQTSSSGQESLVLWARSLLTTGLCDRLIDPSLVLSNYNKDEMNVMMMAARLCLLHSSSRRPSMKTILRLFQEPEKWLEIQRKKDEMELSLFDENLFVED